MMWNAIHADAEIQEGQMTHLCIHNNCFHLHEIEGE